MKLIRLTKLPDEPVTPRIGKRVTCQRCESVVHYRPGDVIIWTYHLDIECMVCEATIVIHGEGCRLPHKQQISASGANELRIWSKDVVVFNALHKMHKKIEIARIRELVLIFHGMLPAQVIVWIYERRKPKRASSNKLLIEVAQGVVDSIRELCEQRNNKKRK